MTSVYKPIIKVLLVSLIITACMGLSVFSTVKESQASSNSLAQASMKSDSKRLSNQPKSQYEKKIHRELSMLMPWNKQFNPRFLNFVLANSSQK
ncbi:MAG: hypothetical protein ACPGTQ_15055 [Colwellia sp.]|uniref:hypothetical protein n=1 Tax=Colwellia sp. KU-HH00111 TaxID=3127652 RepID=UPI0031061E7C